MKSAVIALIFLSFANGAMAQQKIENIFKTSNNIGSSKTFQLTEEARSIYQKRSIQDEVVSTSTVARSRPFTRAFIDYHLKPTYDQRSGELVAISGSIPKLKNHTSHKQRYINYLETVKEVLFLTDPSKEVIKKQSQMDQEGRMHTRLNQIVKGVRVYGSELLVHEKNESIYLLQGNTIKVDRDINIHPEVKP